MDILLTNDDGIRAVGLRALYAALVKAGHRVHVAAPMTEQSAVGHSVTLFSPLRVREVEEPGFSGLGISGTPADCVKLALSHLLPKKPDMIVSGINAGANVGVDVLYSGTVSAATEGALAGIPAMAVSVDDYHPEELSAQAMHLTVIDDAAAPGVGGQRHRLADAQRRQFGFLEIGVHPHLARRHDGHQGAAGGDPLAQLDLAPRNMAGSGRHDLRPAEGKIRRPHLRGRRRDARMRRQRGIVDQHVGANLLFACLLQGRLRFAHRRPRSGRRCFGRAQGGA